MATFGIVLATEARAAASRDYEVIYYQEPALLTQVGSFYKPCGTGAAKLTGRRTRYFIRAQSTCPGGGGGHIPRSTVSCHFTEDDCTDSLVHAVLTSHHKSRPTAAKGAPGLYLRY